ncbi:MAG TPA: plastocyanin/azurin family copper-binding protein [Ktedonobacterales bacterium]
MMMKCTRVSRLTSRGALYVSLLALVILAGCATTSGTTTGGTTTGGTSSAAPTATTAPAATATTATGGSVTMVKIIGASGNYSFSPASVTVKVGDTVTWTNNSNVPHTSTSDSSSAVSWDSSAISTGGGTFSFVFTKAGTYTYHCSFHPFMHGTIVVTA